MAHSSDKPAPDGRLFRAGRGLLGIRQDRLAHLAGITRQKLARIEKGERTVSAAALDSVSAALTRAGVEFVPGTKNRTRGVALRKDEAKPVPPKKRPGPDAS